jgi:hypothetical protein
VPYVGHVLRVQARAGSGFSSVPWRWPVARSDIGRPQRLTRECSAVQPTQAR